ncbi:MAG TPA: hypothetical protein VK616_04680 [Flavitalea sp.]|nr:hypothetical protein [Flavitalea sp.]
MKQCLKAVTFIVFFSSFLTSYSQNGSQMDSVYAGVLVEMKEKYFEPLGVNSTLSLFSNIGNVILIYEQNGEIKAAKFFFKKSKKKFKNIRLSKGDELDYKNCILIASKDTVISFAGCKEFVHSFNNIVFEISTINNVVKGNFTSDCADVLKGNNLFPLFNIYKKFLL